ncbi:MAG TPA: hypothetical protein VK191_02395 [Symbiobacteriaceae bacterium]|nr:hypothetical protein [Symbiobacteriaceae bacterium]
MALVKLTVRSLQFTLMQDLRYPVEFLADLIGSFLWLGVILFGASQFSSAQVQLFATGFLLNVILSEPIGVAVGFLTVRGGSAEEAYCAPVPLPVQLAIQGAASAVRALIVNSVIYIGMALLAGFRPTGLLPLLQLTPPLFFASVGVALVVAGAQLLLKKVQAVSGLIMILFVGAAFTPTGVLSKVPAWLPFATGLKAANGGAYNWAEMALYSLLYAGVGLLIFHGCQRLTVRLGLAGAR